MNLRQFFKVMLTTAPIFFAAASVLGLLTACQTDGTQLSRKSDSVSENFNSPQLSRFFAELDRHIDKDTPAEQIEGAKHLFATAFRKTVEEYVTPPDEERLIDHAIIGLMRQGSDSKGASAEQLVESSIEEMLVSLGAYSAFLNRSGYRDLQAQTRGNFGGLGIEVTMEDGLVRVVAPIDGTPALRAGVEAGDLISHIDDEAVLGLTLDQAVKKMRGKVGSDIKLTVRRVDHEPFEIVITRAVIKIISVRSRLEGEVGYIRVAQFNKQAKARVANAIKKFEEEAGIGLRGIVLDLRNNPGGLLDQAIGVSDLFLDQGEIVSVRSRRSENNHDFIAHPGDLAKGLPMVVLTNGGSAGASEIVAGALQDRGRAHVLGGKSFGKGSVLSIFSLGQQGAMKLTTAAYVRTSGRFINDGIEPDVRVVRESNQDSVSGVGVDERRCPPPSTSEKDRELGCAVELIKAGSLERFVAEYGVRPSARIVANGSSEAGINYGRYYALIIGNNEYATLPDLKNAIADGTEVAHVLEQQYGFKVTSLINATRADIITALDEYRGKLGENDNLLIYYAGHGWLDREAERGYWLPVDASDINRTNWLSNADITDGLKAMKAKHVLVVADSCYSATLSRAVVIRDTSPNYLSRLAQKRSRTVMTSGGLEPVSDSGGGRHSVFAKVFLDLLRENPGVLEGTEMFGKLRRSVLVNARQTPEYGDIRFAGHEGGDFLFVRRE